MMTDILDKIYHCQLTGLSNLVVQSVQDDYGGNFVFICMFDSLIGLSVLSAILNIISVILRRQVFRTIFFPSHWLLSHATIVEAIESGERNDDHQSSERISIEPGIEPATSCSKSCVLPTEAHWLSSFASTVGLSIQLSA